MGQGTGLLRKDQIPESHWELGAGACESRAPHRKCSGRSAPGEAWRHCRALSHPSGQLPATVWEGADVLGEGPDRQWGVGAKGMAFGIGQDSAV